MNILKTIKLTSACLFVLFALLGCGQDEGQVATESQIVYRHGLDGAPNTLDPAQAAVIYANYTVVNLYDTLYRYKYLARPYELTTNLAVDLPEISEDGLTYTIRIKPGVHFIDDEAFADGIGREVVAEDFVYAIKRHFDPRVLAQGAWIWQNRIEGLDDWASTNYDYDAPVSGLQAIDRYTIQIRLIKPYPQLTHTFAMGFSALIPREAVEFYGREISIHPVGSGPFRLTSFSSSRAVMVRNEKYRQEPFDLEKEGYDEALHGFSGVASLAGRTPPFIDRLEHHYVQEDAARWNAFFSGELDFIRAPANQFDTILASRKPIKALPEIAERFHMLAPMESGVVHIDFNLDDERIGYHDDPQQNARNKALRCAIIKAFDFDARNEAIYYDIAQVYPGIIPPAAPEFDPDADPSSVIRDVDGARALLALNGWTPENLPDLEYGFTAGVTQRQMYEQFRSFMGDIGYHPDKIKALNYATFGDFNKAYKERKVMIIPTGWNMDYPDAENVMQLFYGPNEAPGSNHANMKVEEFDRLYEQTAVMQQSDERTAMYRRMNQIIVDECVSMTGLSRTFVFLWDKRMRMYPDRSFVSGYFNRFVAPVAESE
jgi:ABC-type transport system substrate-binding protein